MMDLRQLRYFVEIVERGSLTRAAERLNIAQPALSIYLKNMEALLGTPLLVRARNGLAATGRWKRCQRRHLQPLRSTMIDVAQGGDWPGASLETDGHA